MAEIPDVRSDIWRDRLLRLNSRMRAALPFASGVTAAFLALLLYNVFFPRPHQLTVAEMNASVAQALASATPPPAFSALVYQAIQPSIVLIQTQSPGESDEVENTLGSGVIIDDKGDILTS